MKFKNNMNGLTLIELVVGIALLTIVMSAIISLFAVSIKSYHHNMAQNRNIQEAHKVYNLVIDEIRKANNITHPGPGQADSRIDFTISDSGTVETRSIYLDNTAHSILIKKNEAIYQTTAVNITQTLTFSRDSIGKTVTISAVFNDQTNGSNDMTITTSVVASNM